MMVSDKERREIARRLRAAAKTKSHSTDYLWRHLEIAVNGWRYGDAINESYVFDNDVLSRLAELIDPTCTSVLAKDKCSVCGEPLGSHANYCPKCGARVVDDD